MELPMCQTENNCTNRVEYIAPKEFIRTDFQCKEVTTSHVVIKQIALVIYNAQAEDVGSYTCSSINFDTDKEVKYHAGTIHVGKGHWSSWWIALLSAPYSVHRISQLFKCCQWIESQFELLAPGTQDSHCILDCG